MASASGSSTLTPSCNRLLQKKWDDRKQKEHRERLHSIKSSLDNGKPQEFVHIKQNLRKHKIEEERQQTIQRHNNKLLARMHQIMTTTGHVDHRNTHWKSKKSLNYMKRANEMDKITKENQRILDRIQQVRPQYSVESMNNSYLTHKSRTKSISLFPPIAESPTKAQRGAFTQQHSQLVPLPPIPENKPSPRPETHASEIKEEIEVDVDN